MFQNSKFSLFASIGDLSHYNFEELKEKVSHLYQLKVQSKNADMIVTWNDKFTELVLHYTLDGKFIKIFSETWTYPKFHFQRK